MGSVFGYETSAVSDFAIPLAECTMFVSTGGADLNTGTTPESAFKTIKKGLESINPGQALCIKGGTYTEVLTLSHQGTEVAPITFGGYSGGGEVVLSGGYKLPNNKCSFITKKNLTKATLESCHDSALVSFSGAKFIHMYAVTLRESSGTGIFIDSSSSNLVFKSVKSLDNNLSGMKIGETCKDVMSCSKLGTSIVNIDNSSFINNSVLANTQAIAIGAGIYAGDSILSHLTLSNSKVSENVNVGVFLHNSDFITVSNNAISDNQKQNMFVKNNNNFLIDKNVFLCTDKGLSRFATTKNTKSLDYATGLQIGGAANQKAGLVDYIGYTVTNNIISGCSTNLVLNAQKTQLKNTNIINNTLVNARTRLKRISGSRSLLLIGFNIQALSVSNNIILQKDDKVRTVVGIIPTAALQMESNIVYPSISKSLVDKGFIVSDPKLKDPFMTIEADTFDALMFTPNEDSPVLGKGVDVKLPTLLTDYRNAQRSTLDIGAVQGSSAAPQNEDPEGVTDGLISEDPEGVTDELMPEDPAAEDPVTDETADPDTTVEELLPVEDMPVSLDDTDSVFAPNLEEEIAVLPETGLEEEIAVTEDTPILNEDPYDFSTTDELYTDSGPSESLFDTSTDVYQEQDFFLTDEVVEDSAVFGTLPDEYASAGGEILKNGNFDLGKNTKGMPLNWFVKTGVGGSVSLSLDGVSGEADTDKLLKLKVLKLPEKGYVELYQNGLSLDPQKKYKLTFKVKSDMGSDIDLYIANAVFPYENLLNTKYNVDLKPDWKEYTGIIGLATTPAQDGKVRLVLSFKASVGDSIIFDSISLYEVSDDLVSVKSGNLITSLDLLSSDLIAAVPVATSN